MTRISFWNEPDEFQSDGETEIEWLQPAGDIESFPYRGTFSLNGYEWYIELNVLPGRFGDRLHMYLMQIINDNYYARLDITLNNGVQINVDNKLLIYPFDVDPVFDDLYALNTGNKIEGTYKIGVAPYV